jgi:hypothetical protein
VFVQRKIADTQSPLSDIPDIALSACDGEQFGVFDRTPQERLNTQLGAQISSSKIDCTVHACQGTFHMLPLH